MATRRNGGIISDEMIAGSLIYFKIGGDFAYTLSDGTVTVAGTEFRGGDPMVTTYHLVGEGKPVPSSFADHVIRVLQWKCNIASIGVIGAPGAETALHLAIHGSAFGWLDLNGDIDTAAMVTAIGSLGALDVPTTSGGAVGDMSATPVTATVSSVVTVTNVPFVLA